MRILLLIVMVIGWLAAAGLGLMIGNENLLSENAETLNKLAEGTTDESVLMMVDGVRMSGIGGFVLALLTTIGVVLTFMKKDKPLMIVAVLGVIAAIAFIALSPSFDTGPTGAADPRQQAMIYGIAGAIALLAGFGAEKVRQKKAAGA